MNKNSAIGRSWDEVEKELYTPEEIAAGDLRVSYIGRITARRKMGKCKPKLEELRCAAHRYGSCDEGHSRSSD